MVIEAYLPDGTILPAAVGVFPSWKTEEENVEGGTTENACFMWEELKRSTLGPWLAKSSGSLTILTDRSSGVLEGVEKSLPHADIVYCGRHLLSSLRRHCEGEQSEEGGVGSGKRLLE